MQRGLAWLLHKDDTHKSRSAKIFATVVARQLIIIVCGICLGAPLACYKHRINAVCGTCMGLHPRPNPSKSDLIPRGDVDKHRTWLTCPPPFAQAREREGSVTPFTYYHRGEGYVTPKGDFDKHRTWPTCPAPLSPEPENAKASLHHSHIIIMARATLLHKVDSVGTETGSHAPPPFCPRQKRKGSFTPLTYHNRGKSYVNLERQVLAKHRKRH